MEKIEAVTIDTDKGKRVLHQFNTAIFLHNPEFAGVDHIFEEIGNNQGIFYWRRYMENFDGAVELLGSIGVASVIAEEPSPIDWRNFLKTSTNEQINWEGDDPRDA